MIENRVKISHWLTALARVHCPLGKIRERGNILKLTKNNNFHKGSPKQMRKSHSVRRSMWLSFRHVCWEKYLQFLFTHGTLINVRFATSVTYRIILPGTAEFSILHFFPKLRTLVLKREKRAGLLNYLVCRIVIKCVKPFEYEKFLSTSFKRRNITWREGLELFIF